VALDSIALTAIIPSPPKSAGTSTGPTGSTGPVSPADSNSPDDPANAAGRPPVSDSTNRGTDRGATHSTRDSSDHSRNTGSTDKRPTRSTDSSEARAHTHAGPRSKPNASHATKQTQDTKAARGTQSAAGAQQRKGTATSFVDALAQLQADAAPNADPTTTPAFGETSGTSGKTKDAHDDPSGDAVTATALAFIPQSVAAVVMAAAAQSPTQAQSNLAVSADSAEDDSVAALGTNGRTSAQAAVGALTDGGQDLEAATSAASDLKGEPGPSPSTTPAPTAPAADASSAAAVAFQAHMSISSHFQQVPADAVNSSKVSAPVGTPAFNDEFGGKITWLANQGVQSASLQLSPEHLGPVNVHISVQDGSASVSFNAAHADTRAALEQALPRLREMFSTQGLTLTDANVSHQSPRGQSQKHSVGSISARGGARADSSATSITSVASSRLGLVDTYA
jgi:flagellar hook-length control protein FliK